MFCMVYLFDINIIGLIIRFCRDPVFLPYINVDWAAIEIVSQVKVIGVTLSSDLSWIALVDGIVSKARKRVFMQ